MSSDGPLRSWRPSYRAQATGPAVGLLVALMLSVACRNRPPDDPRDYAGEIAATRAAKDAAFKTASDSPVAENRRAELLPLAYFPIDPLYKTAAVLRLSSDSTILQVATSTGGIRQMRRVGKLEFALKGQPLTLTAFAEVGASDLTHLFVPFADLTTGNETYPGGRYLDLVRNATGIYEIDFNRAYFPYCYYSPTYECPYPPAENRLRIPIRAGERFRT